MDASELAPVFTSLRSQGIEVLPHSLAVHHSQGWMSTVYTADSSRGRLIFHVTRLARQHEETRVWEKFQGLKSLFAAHSSIPTPPIYFADLVKGVFVLVQHYADGTQAGNRVIKNGAIIDERDVQGSVEATLAALAPVHEVTLRGFGWPTYDGELAGPHASWKLFLEAVSRKWIDAVAEADEHLQLPPLPLTEYIFGILGSVMYDAPAVLVHGDAINPSNVLMKDEKAILLDWEWSIAADPAWEFAALGWGQYLESTTFAVYQKARTMSQDELEALLERARKYQGLWLLWGAHVHAHARSEVYMILRDLLSKKMDQL